MRSWAALLLFSWIAVGCLNEQSASAEEPDAKKVVAVIDGVPVTHSELESAAVTDIDGLELRRLEFEAKQKQNRYQILRKNLDDLIANKLFDREARERGISRDELLAAEIEGQVAEPTEEEIDRIYTINKTRLQRPLEAVRTDIVSFLKTNQRNIKKVALVDSLKKKFEVEDRLEPLRFEIQLDGHPTTENVDAPVTLVEFSDFECPYCSQMSTTLQRVREKYGDDVRRIFRQFPLNGIHPRAQKAAEASLCANDQGRFWEMMGRLFEKPLRLDVAALKSKAETLGVDSGTFDGCLDSAKFAGQVALDIAAGARIGVNGTPAVFINGRPVQGNATFQTIALMVDEELAARGKPQ